ncbi:LysR family transcriptional regulator [Pararobbsia silviterrae]|uniref:LysR family transcriptional regulator n=1 Tax=Pararobbsia silviterrae TaxID=1792498 RepID=A0A494YAD6_9BURK|nr:LysR family transcriptional regulator [Pararobbsia silviterrae]RKP59125.1 LysR family transcriptional regulator [Pararobbsia silviterrae]
MDIRALRYFVEVVRRQGFTAAADALFVTQPTISKMVRQIEEEVGTPLLVRDGRTVAPTETGRIVYQRGLEMLELQARLEAELAEASSGMRGELAISVPPLASMLLTPVLAEFHRLHPGVRLKLFERGSLRGLEDLRENRFEIAGLMMPVDRAELASVPLARSPLRLVTPAGGPWQGRETVSFAELSQASFVMYGEGFSLNDLVTAACARHGFTPRVSGQSTDWNMLARMVEIGVGVAVLPDLFCAQLDRDQVDVVAFAEPDLVWDMAMCWRRNAHLSSAARAWIHLAETMLGPRNP